MTVLSVPYEHPVFPAGCTISIDPAILEAHCDSPLAGQTVQTCFGFYSPRLESEHRLHTVPVAYGGTIYYVEEVYVQASLSGE